MEKINLALLGSGGGSTIVEAIRAIQAGDVPGAQLRLVVSSDPNAGLIEKVLGLGVAPEDVCVIEKKGYESDEAFGEALCQAFDARGIQLYGQLGWLPLTPASVVRNYAGWNQHPGPIDPPRLGFGGRGMYGTRVHAAVLYFAERCGRDFFATEVTAQLVHPQYDGGAILGIAEVPIFPDDTPEMLQKRALAHEHRLQVATMKLMVSHLIEDGQEGIQTIVRESPLIQPGEEGLLREAMDYARREHHRS